MIQTLCCLLSLAALLTQTTKPNFSGTWRFDKERSTSKKTIKATPGSNEAPPPPPPESAPPPQLIEHNEPRLKISVKIPGDDYEMVYELTTDGSENSNWMPNHVVEHKSKSFWQGDRLITEFRMVMKDKVLIEGRETRSISSDGRTMVVERELEDSKSKTTARQVMIRE